VLVVTGDGRKPTVVWLDSPNQAAYVGSVCLVKKAALFCCRQILKEDLPTAYVCSVSRPLLLAADLQGRFAASLCLFRQLLTTHIVFLVLFSSLY
jgi:hypothetical protein